MDTDLFDCLHFFTFPGLPFGACGGPLSVLSAAVENRRLSAARARR